MNMPRHLPGTAALDWTGSIEREALWTRTWRHWNCIFDFLQVHHSGRGLLGGKLLLEDELIADWAGHHEALIDFDAWSLYIMGYGHTS